MKTFKKIIFGVLTIIILLVASIYGYLTYLKPSQNGTINLPKLKSEVEVLYDNYGIPHIYAENEEDLFYTFGYVHAQDRLFQMEVLRRLADGRLSELFGEAALESDKFFRTLSFREHAKLTMATTYKDPNSPFVIAAKAYIKGINEYIKNGKTPIEYSIAGIPKTEFTLEDMEIIVGYMGYTFVGAFGSEAVSTDILNRLGPDYYKDVLAAWPDSLYKIPVQANLGAAKNLAIMANSLSKMDLELPYPPFHGSNGWVIAGKKTKSGKPILSNDTHIAFSQPSVWYEAHLECPTFKIYGNFLAGTPVPALGHNDKGGWGLTMFENDDADFFRETLNPANPNQVKYKDTWEDIIIRKETIKVKDKPDVVLDVKKTRHGYLLNGAFKNVENIKDPIALWWVYHQFPSQHLNVFYNVCKSKNANEMAKAVAPLTSPGLNFMWGDTEGNIGWWAAGKLPIRPKHVNPAVILDGSTGLDDPQGWYDFSLNPQILNPERGVLYTANNQPEDMGNGLVPGYYVPANRAKRIEDLIFTDKIDWTEESVREVINDVKSSMYPATVKSIFEAIPESEMTQEGKDLKKSLMAWDGSHNLENIEPTIFYKLLYNIMKLSLQDELGAEEFAAFEHNFSLKRNTSVFLNNDNSKWWDNVSTPEKETRKAIFTKALALSSQELVAQLGKDQSQWKWGKVHSIEHKHPLGIVPVIGKWFNVGPIPVNGGRETINNLDFFMDSTGTYKVVYGPALRRIIDFGNPEAAQSVNPTGQSGYFMSKNYDDQAEMFATGGKRPELTNRKDIEKAMKGKLVFKP
ncbi:penicillin acylase family protein [Lacihabitans sp. LS3-19]|uniref:penicillin acylase family protein n=1 Tax=Lacihabitans sp. LS3-19 TaxID=2487335 RepID=UPI0020CD06DC|nr:penicillin acylase family protein [Lacihabitans sp. LS3-19]MCP9769367.1 penicillin acylase family protein [Lacihabitans sp. LS3-19]